MYCQSHWLRISTKRDQLLETDVATIDSTPQVVRAGIPSAAQRHLISCAGNWRRLKVHHSARASRKDACYDVLRNLHLIQEGARVIEAMCAGEDDSNVHKHLAVRVLTDIGAGFHG